MARPPKTKKQHDRDGTARHHRHDHLADAPEATGSLTKPRWLTGEGARMWKLVLPLVEEAADTGAIDSFQLAAMCDWWSVYRDKRANGVGWRDAGEARAAFGEFSKLASRFGLTPLDRQALHTQGTKAKPGDAKFLRVVR